MKTITLSW